MWYAMHMMWFVVCCPDCSLLQYAVVYAVLWSRTPQYTQRPILFLVLLLVRLFVIVFTLSEDSGLWKAVPEPRKS